MKRRHRHSTTAPPPATPAAGGWTNPISPTGFGYQATTAPPGQVQTLRMIPVVSCDPVPFETAVDHQATLVWSGTVNGPAMQSGEIVNDAFESLAAVALRIGADGLYTIRLNTAVDHGWIFVTATATATLPRRTAPSPAPPSLA